MRVFTVSGYPSAVCRSVQFAEELRQTLAFAAPAWRVHTCVVGDRAAVNDANAAIVVDRDNRAGDQPGLLVPTGNVEALGAAIDQLLDDQNALQSAQDATDQLGRHLSWSALGPGYVEVLTEAAQRALEPATTGPRLSAA